MKTMRTLSITMLLAGCGLHATDSGVTETTNLGNFVIVDDYQGQSHESTFGSDESMEEIPTAENLVESEQEFFDGFASYFDQSKIDEPIKHDTQETVMEQKHSIAPTIITVGALVGVGYVVYKYATKNESKNAENSKMNA